MIETHEGKVCPICQRPKSGGGAGGSITQWISVCRCNLEDNQHNDAAENLRVCADCRKRVNPSKGGTITQWIFSENFCKCDNPRLVPIEPNELDVIGVRSAGDDDASSQVEEVLEVDPSVFPVERYKPLRFIGKGALGEVYLCRDVYLKKKVAVKCLLNLTADRVVSFQNEAKIASKLNHESVISVMDFGTTSGGRPFMVMEYFPGKSLQEIISESGKIDEVDAIELFAPVCRSLSYLHESGVLHRDLKPSNVLVSVKANGAIDVRLIDFGLSKTTQDVQSKTLIDGHTIVGTPGYMSPDQIRGQAYDTRSEIYSLGCMMFETVTGSQPYNGETALAVLNNHVHQPVPSVSEVEPTVSVGLSKLIEKCLSKDASDRFASMKEVETVLSSCRRGRGLEPPSIDSPEHDPANKSGTAPSLSPKSWTLVLAALGLVITTSIAFVCWSVFRPIDPAEAPPLMKKSTEAGVATAEKSDFHAALNDVSESRQALLDVGAMDPAHGIATNSIALQDGTDLIVDHKGRVTELLKIVTKVPPKNPKVKLIGCDLVAGDATIIASVDPLEVSMLKCSGVTDDTLAELTKAARIQSLTLDECNRISPKGLKQLEKFPDLAVVSLKGCNLNDEHIKAMRGLKALRLLSINRNDNVTVAGLKNFSGRPEPMNIYLDLGSLGPDANKVLREHGVLIYYNHSNLN